MHVCIDMCTVRVLLDCIMHSVYVCYAIQQVLHQHTPKMAVYSQCECTRLG